MQEKNHNYFTVIESSILYDKDLTSTEKILYGIISGLSQKNGQCYASINHFCDVLNIKRRQVFYCLSHLKEKSYIIVNRQNNKIIIKPVIGELARVRDRYPEKVIELIDYNWINDVS